MPLKIKRSYQYLLTFFFVFILITLILFCLTTIVRNLYLMDEEKISQLLSFSILPSIKLTFFYSFLTSIISTLSGLIIVYYLREIPRVFILISSIPHLAFAHLIWLNYYSGGFWSKVSFMISGEKLSFLSSSQGWGIILGFVLKELPFAVLVLAPLFKKELQLIEESALSLGANKYEIITKVIIPTLKAPLIGIILILFTYTYGAFEIPFILSPDQIKPLAVLALESFNSIDLSDRNITYMISLIIFSMNLVIYLIFSKAFVTNNQRLEN